MTNKRSLSKINSRRLLIFLIKILFNKNELDLLLILLCKISHWDIHTIVLMHLCDKGKTKAIRLKLAFTGSQQIW